MDRFILNYNGNKYNETKKYLNDFILNSNYSYIAEPFGGIFGFSRYYYLLKNNKNLKFLINDIDTDLINFYKDLKKDFDSTINKIKKDFETLNINQDKELTKYLIKNKDDFKIIRLISMSTCSCYSIKKFETKINNFIKKKNEYIDMFKKIEFYNLEFNEFLELHNRKKNILFYFDPPYFNSNNLYYDTKFIDKNDYHDGTSIYIQILKHFEKNEKNLNISNLFVLNKIDIINYIFKKYIHSEYKGIYQNTKNKKHHIIYGVNINK